jgi:hypothetical protein
MPSEGEIRIVRVSPEQTGGLWPLVEPWLRKGLTAATDLSMPQIRADLLEREADLWAAIVPGKVVGAFLTSLYEHEDGGTFVGVYGLGGSDLARWADQLGDTMRRFAGVSGARCVRFHGRDAWARILPEFADIGTRQGHHVYEGAAI